MFDRPCSKRDSVYREGSGVPQNEGNRPPTVETGVLLIGRGVAYRKTGLHGVLFISTANLLQPPRATVHPPSTSSSLHLRLFIHALLFIQPPPRYSTGYCSTTPLHRLLFNHSSTGYCSSTPPQSTVHLALHGVVLFIQPSTPRGPVHPEATPPLTVHPKPPATLTVHPIDRLHLAAVAKESLDRVQLTAIDRSIGFSNA